MLLLFLFEIKATCGSFPPPPPKLPTNVTRVSGIKVLVPYIVM